MFDEEIEGVGIRKAVLLGKLLDEFDGVVDGCSETEGADRDVDGGGVRGNSGILH